ncbi:MAG: GAF domain-containing protein [Burkholderiales bacterium]|nr:GAF domain-containing protein [Burkholderiales bacterium]
MNAIAPAAPPSTAILAEIAAGLAHGGDLPELLRRFLEPVVRLAGAGGGAVRVLSETDQRLHRISVAGDAAPPCRSQTAADRHCGACGTAVDALRLVWLGDAACCNDGAAGPSMLVVPLQHRGRVLGVYNLYYESAVEPDAEVQSLLKSVGELLGLALDNARLERENLRASLLRERQLMAADVHDALAQSLAFVRVRLPLLQDAMLAHDDERALRYWGDVKSAVGQAHASLRAILTHLRVPMDPQGLVHALGVSAETFRRSSGAELEFVNEVPGLKLAPERETQVFHIVQEALANIARHAAAGRATLRIAPAALPSVAVAGEIVVDDDGAGIAAGARDGAGHYGLEIMRERAQRIGGTLEVGARPGGGTRVRLAFPIEQARA